jgi:hypothetical protein
MMRRSRGPACGDATRNHAGVPPAARRRMNACRMEAAA